MGCQMTGQGLVLATDAKRIAGMVSAAREIGRVTVIAVGTRPIAEAAAAAGADLVIWLEPAEGVPPEAYGPSVAAAVSAAKPRVILASATPPARALLGAAAVALDATIVPGILSISPEGDAIVVDRLALGGGGIVETFACAGTLAGVFSGEDPEATGAFSDATIERLDASRPLDLRVEKSQGIDCVTDVLDRADRVIAFGRGLKAKSDLSLLSGLVAALGAEIACSGPIAQDFGWLPRDRYVGRTGRHISPRLYVAIGISGAPQHLDGIRDAKVVVAVNSDPEAPIFRRADYGIVGDLYEVLPALEAALRGAQISDGFEETNDG
jgi:electron transfer flavoprotein alpha subunit